MVVPKSVQKSVQKSATKIKEVKKPKSIENPIAKVNKIRKKKRFESFSIYIYKVLRSIAKENVGISQTSMLIMNNFVNDMLEKIASEAGRLVVHGKKNTLSSREIQSAIKLLMPPEIAKHANMEGVKAITLYHNSRSKDAAKT